VPLSAALRTLKLGRLVSFDWKLGVGVRSSSCQSLRVAYITIVLRVDQPGQGIKTCPMELTIEEFQVIATDK
jgi:hypothetical protein